MLEAKILSMDITRGNVETYTYVNNELVAEAVLSFVIGNQDDMKNNPFIHKLEEFFHIIKPAED